MRINAGDVNETLISVAQGIAQEKRADLIAAMLSLEALSIRFGVGSNGGNWVSGGKEG